MSAHRWIFCGGMWRSGSTVQYQIAARLVEAHGVGRRLSYTPAASFADLAKNEESGEPGVLVLKSHVCAPAMRDRLEAGVGSVLACHRDPRDLVVSQADKEGTAPAADWAVRTAMTAIEQYGSWRGPWPVYETTYESLRTDLFAEVVRTARAIGLPADDGLAAEIAGALAPDAQRARLDAIAERDGWAEAGTSRVRFDPVELLNERHLGDGATGKWRDRLPVASALAIERAAGDWMRAHGYGVSVAGGGVS